MWPKITVGLVESFAMNVGCTLEPRGFELYLVRYCAKRKHDIIVHIFKHFVVDDELLA